MTNNNQNELHGWHYRRGSRYNAAHFFNGPLSVCTHALRAKRYAWTPTNGPRRCKACVLTVNAARALGAGASS